jgi:myo-inositol-1(or 4)-monophosphatase
VDAESVLNVLREAAAAVGERTADCTDRRAPGTRTGQYAVDLVADTAAVGVLHSAGLRVFSEESGTTVPDLRGEDRGAAELLAVLDPIDGSTNASRGLSPYSTSICVLDREGPWVGLVHDHTSGASYEAVRGSGASRSGKRISVSRCVNLNEAIVAISGLPNTPLGWSQFRAYGAASLELCYVAEGSLDAFARAGGSWLYPWDYLAGLLICQEAGGVVVDLNDENLLVSEAVGRAPVAAASEDLVRKVQRAIKGG